MYNLDLAHIETFSIELDSSFALTTTDSKLLG
jgi:hypothetical protein